MVLSLQLVFFSKSFADRVGCYTKLDCRSRRQFIHCFPLLPIVVLKPGMFEFVVVHGTNVPPIIKE
jgi:hypothetical protein